MAESLETPHPLASAPVHITSSGLKQILDLLPDAMVVVNQEGTIRLVNRQSEALFGYPREELLTQPLEILLPERFRKDHVSRREQYASAPHARPMGIGLQLFGRKKDGSEFPVDISRVLSRSMACHMWLPPFVMSLHNGASNANVSNKRNIFACKPS